MHHDRPRRGTTLVEQLAILAISAILLGTTVASGARVIDAVQTRNAARDVADLLTVARDHAVSDGRRTAVRFDSRNGRVVVHANTDTLMRLELELSHAVRLESSRDSMAYAPTGLGFGAANLRVIVQRGRSADTVTVSRLGRVRR